MRSIAAFVLVVAVLAADVSSVVGQVPPFIDRGSRVRITAPSLGLNEAVGTVQEATDEAFVIQFDARRMGTVDRSEIEEMDVFSTGTRSVDRPRPAVVHRRRDSRQAFAVSRIGAPMD